MIGNDIRLAVIGLLVVSLLVSWLGLRPSGPAYDASDAFVQEDSLPPYPADIPLLKLPDGVVPLRYELDLHLDPDADRYSGVVRIEIDIQKPVDAFFLHGQSQEVENAKLIAADGSAEEVTYQEVHRQGVAKISLSKVVQPGPYVLVLPFQTTFNERLDALYKVAFEAETYVYSQMQAIAARGAFPCFDEPRFKTPFDVSVTARAGDLVVTNGAEISKTVLDNGQTHYRFEVTNAIPTALLAFAVGPMDVMEFAPIQSTFESARQVPLRGFAPKGHGEKLSYILETSAPLVAYFEEYFDTPFPYAKLDLVAVPDFDAGAMENVGAIFYRDFYAYTDENSTTGDLTDILDTNAHEIAHMWFGNYVTPKFWDDIWLNESFATWIAVKASHALEPDWKFEEATQRSAHDIMGFDSYAATRQIRQPILEHNDIMNIWDGISYEKGAGVLHMFETFLGESGFREGVRAHMKRHSHAVADADDFLDSLASGSGESHVAEALKTFLYQPGVPLLNMELDCSEGGATLAVAQQRSLPLGSQAKRDVTWTIPMCYRADGERHCALLSEPETRIRIGDACPASFVPNANADGYYLWSVDDQTIARLIDAVDDLNMLEKMSLIKSLEASYKAGETDGAAVIEMASALANDPEADVVASVIELLVTLDNTWREAENRPDFNGVYRQLFHGKLEALGFDDNTSLDLEDPLGAERIRSLLVPLFAFRVRDETLRQELLKIGTLVTGYGDDEVLKKDLAPIIIQGDAMGVAHEELGAGFAELLIRHLGTASDEVYRRDIRYALSKAPNEAQAIRLADRLFKSESLRSNEAQSFAFQFLQNSMLRDSFIAWLQTDDHLIRIAQRGSLEDSASMLRYGNYICDAETRESYFAYAGEVAKDISGAPRILSQVAENMDQCIAIRAALAAQ